MTQTVTPDVRTPSWSEWLVAFVVGGCLSAFVWQGLVKGGGLVGGDTYPYFFPQKQTLAESFSAGRVPLWNDRTSLGYPMHAESQAGVFYPTNQILYRLFDVNTAYSVSVLLHYAFAFVFVWRFARSQWLSQTAAMFAAIVFVYGWFPVRISLEWSIIGGVWMPLSLWIVDGLLDRPSRKRWLCLTMCFAVQLLAGHFTLAFISQLTCLGFAFLSPPRGNSASEPAAASGALTKDRRPIARWRMTMLIAASIACAAVLAAVQLVPTLELRQLSQRDGTHSEFDPGYGHMPPVYLTQLVASWWYWHTPEIALSREMLKHPFLMSGAATNPVEAHLYLGLIPLLLLVSLVSGRIRRQLKRSQWKTWFVLSLMAVVYSFGWLVPVFRHLPGFGFFMGPGRYTIITCLGLAIVGGLVLDVLLRRQRRIVRLVVTIVISAVTLVDVLKSAEFPVCDAQVVDEPPIIGLEKSWVASMLKEEDQRTPVRLLAPGPNVCNLFGVSCVPQYLGLGPAAYFSPDAAVQSQPGSTDQLFPTAEQVVQLRRLSVTHVLTTEPVSNLSPDCEPLAFGPDTFLNRVWARGRAECFLYRVRQPKERVSAEPAAALTNWSMIERDARNVRFRVDLSDTATVELCELMFPGWQVQIDDQPVEPKSQSGFGRSAVVPAGAHVVHWSYRPTSFRTGVLVSAITALVLVIGCVWPRKMTAGAATRN